MVNFCAVKWNYVKAVDFKLQIDFVNPIKQSTIVDNINNCLQEVIK